MSDKMRMTALAFLVVIGVAIIVAMVQETAPDCSGIAKARIGSMLLYGCN